ncbi:MAG: hypothetical protein HY047_15705, partial [Acidobacteria bacterium]|nr:hypothetical protein [Acidobacteriota bacterium]
MTRRAPGGAPRHARGALRASKGVAAWALVFALAGGGCRSRTDAGSRGGSRERSERSAPTDPDGRALLPVALPDVSKMAPSVQKQ